jgi:hypothetical protein
MALVNSHFDTRNHFFENYQQFGKAPLKIFAIPILGRESVKNIGFKKLRIISLARGTQIFRADPELTNNHTSTKQKCSTTNKESHAHREQKQQRTSDYHQRSI